MTRSSPRRGMALYLVLAVVVVATVVMMTYLCTVLQEHRGMSSLVRETRARSVADAAISRIASLINQRPFEERFYLVWAQAHGKPQPEYVFDSEVASRSPIFEFRDFKAEGIEFRGQVRDASVSQKISRVKLEVVCSGFVLHSIYDVRFEEGLLGALNREHVVCMKDMPDLSDVQSDDVDLRMEAIEAEANRPEKLVSDPADQELLRSYQENLEAEAADLDAFDNNTGLLATLDLPDDSNPPPEPATGKLEDLTKALQDAMIASARPPPPPAPPPATPPASPPPPPATPPAQTTEQRLASQATSLILADVANLCPDFTAVVQSSGWVPPYNNQLIVKVALTPIPGRGQFANWSAVYTVGREVDKLGNWQKYISVQVTGTPIVNSPWSPVPSP